MRRIFSVALAGMLMVGISDTVYAHQATNQNNGMMSSGEIVY
ncbi:hypothetical protein [Hippea maritima]|uniref:Uncharacterized protein n=1 Tax=Hippea maritima (strain ATCC 700847 / DSM 10411 / MH2) TaxID=760142 RepID=F2LVD3_HIPMA|nr:hypothetical protein [Hippea maritima]AEA33717.1 hypothetical protein Hipma_0747 [Hippea maritima DSM 10411]